MKFHMTQIDFEKIKEKKLHKALSLSGPQTVGVVRNRWGHCLFLVLITVLLKMYFGQWHNPQGVIRPGNETLTLIATLGDFAIDLFMSIYVLILAPLTVLDLEARRPFRSVWAWSHQTLWPLTIEGLRVLTFTLLWSLALIIPGLYKMVRYSFVPFVVMFDPQYENEDALERSHKLTVGVFWVILLVMIASQILSLLLLLPNELFTGMAQHVVRFFTTLLTLVFSIYTLLVSFNIYRIQAAQTTVAVEEGGSNGTHV
ncbi:MAG: hypothetical protein KDD34_01495 [Bdellovibrionales bacterium]|nr:hypothetical protein [Bdellovibrionales bacterium]